MEHLWAPWRNSYVTETDEKRDALFTEIAQSTEDERNFVLARRKSCFALLNLYPYNTGHTMIVPYRQVNDLDLLSDEETLELMTLLKTLKKALVSVFAPHGFNVGLNLGSAAGAGIAEHLHLHLVPRWRNDANFMTSTAETRVHPNDLPTVYAALMRHLS